MTCRVCNSTLARVIDFGSMPIANDFSSDNYSHEYRFDLIVSYCPKCKLAQLETQPDPNLMFHDDYKFFTGLSISMTDHFRKFALDALSEIPTTESEIFVVEIGSNDGTLLSNVANKGIKHLGIDPSSNVSAIAASKGVNTRVDFFGYSVAESVAQEFGNANLILAANVICHIPDLNDFAKGIKKLLHATGKFIFEEPYIGDVIQKTSYDQFYDEHVYVFGCLSVSEVFSRHNLRLIDAEHQDTHGGSMRYTVTHVENDYEPSVRLLEQIKFEKRLGLDDLNAYTNFANNCLSRKKELRDLLFELKASGHSIAGYAATSKSTTILNYCGIDSQILDYISDSTPEKIGGYAPGSHIRIISHEEMRKNPPDYLVNFAWNHEVEILEKEKDLIKNGVKWIRFVPFVEVLK